MARYSFEKRSESLKSVCTTLWKRGEAHMNNMIDKEILDALAENVPLQATIRLQPTEYVRLRPNVIFDYVYSNMVLHLGCTDQLSLINEKVKSGIYLHTQLSRIASECLGIDTNKAALEHLYGLGITNIIYADITKPGIGRITDEHWDYLIIAEVLEHIDNPVLFLQDIALYYKGSIDRLIITVPNAFGLINVSQALKNGVESINSDHRYWFTPYTICQVARQAGLVLDELVMCVYENSAKMIDSNYELLLDKPLLMDAVLLVAHWE